MWAIAIVDIDHFKRVNDQHGHAVGDMVLKEVAAIIKSQCRHGDHFARFGGEEFILLLVGETKDDISRLAQSPVDRCSGHGFRSDTRAIGQVTISIGLSFFDRVAPPNLEDSFRKADKALCEAKKSGRNQISLASPHDLKLVAGCFQSDSNLSSIGGTIHVVATLSSLPVLLA